MNNILHGIAFITVPRNVFLGFVIFVAGAKAGQKTNIRITSIGDRFGKAQVV
jgi:predicted RNA-binding protein with TRAM domain